MVHYNFHVISILDTLHPSNFPGCPPMSKPAVRKGRSWLVPRPRRCSAGGEMLMPTFPGKCWWERKQTEDWYGYSLREKMAVEACFLCPKATMLVSRNLSFGGGEGHWIDGSPVHHTLLKVPFNFEHVGQAKVDWTVKKGWGELWWPWN